MLQGIKSSLIVVTTLLPVALISPESLLVAISSFLLFVLLNLFDDRICRANRSNKIFGSRTITEFILGASLATLPVLGTNFLLGVVGGYLISRREVRDWRCFNCFLPYLGIMLAWVAIYLFLDLRQFHRNQISTLIDNPQATLEGLILTLRMLPERAIYGVVSLSSIVLALLMFASLATRRSARESLLFGAIVGASLSALVALFQQYNFAFGARFELFGVPEGFWAVAGRAGGLFSDPNSLGVFCAMLLPFLISKVVAYPFLCSPALVILIATPLMTGSRTFVLALLIIGFFFAHRFYRKLTLVLTSLAVLVVISLNSLSFDFSIASSYLPLALRRLVETVNFATIEESFYSRTIFWRAAIQMWFDHLFLGVGFGRFQKHLIPYNFSLNAREEMWIDNPNSFYLGVLVEMGVVGAVVLYLTLRAFKFRAEVTSLEKLSLLLIATLLVIGPHLNFLEVSVLFAVLMAGVVEPRGQKSQYLGYVPIVLMPFIAVAAISGEYGLYGWNKSSSGMSRWSGQHSRIAMQCTSGEATLRLQGDYDGVSSEAPILGDLLCEGRNFPLSIQDRGVHQVVIPCSGQTGSRDRLWCNLTLHRVYVPARRASTSRDFRRLGLKVDIGAPIVP